jgi:hypothetical protein
MLFVFDVIIYFKLLGYNCLVVIVSEASGSGNETSSHRLQKMKSVLAMTIATHCMYLHTNDGVDTDTTRYCSLVPRPRSGSWFLWWSISYPVWFKTTAIGVFYSCWLNRAPWA